MSELKGRALFEERLLARRQRRAASNGNVKFDPFSILTVLMALLPLLIECFKPTPASLRNRGAFAARRAAIRIRREDPSISWQEADEWVADAFAVVDEMTDAELQSVIDEAV